MKRSIAALALVLGLSAPAAAADLAYKASPYLAPVSAFSWTGFYVGGHVGYLWGVTDNDTLFLPNAAAAGAFVGVQGGYRYQFANNFVLGAQISAPLWAQDQTKYIFGVNRNHVEFKGSVLGQLQLGYAIGRWMPFLTAGAGFARVDATENNSPVVSNTHTLATAGFGVNYAITDHVTTGVRWNHLWTSKERYDCGPANCGLIGNFSLSADTVTAVLEYKF